MLPAQRRLEEGLQQVNGPDASPEECTKLSRGSNGNGHTGGHRQCSGECAGQVPIPRWGGGGPRGTPPGIGYRKNLVFLLQKYRAKKYHPAFEHLEKRPNISHRLWLV